MSEPTATIATNLDGPSMASVSVVDDEEVGIYNAVAVILKCKEHKSMALQKLPGKDYLWFPVAKLSEADSHQRAATNLLTQLLSSKKGNLEFSKPRFVQLCRFQISQTGHFAELYIFCSEINGTRHRCCSAITSLEWFTKVDIDEPRVWGPEPSVYKEVADPSEAAFISPVHEFTVADVKNLLPKAGTPPRTVFDALLFSAKMDEKDLREIFAEFVKHCFPARSMNLTSFVDYMSRIGWSRDEKVLERTYRSFKVHDIKYVRINELVFGLAAFSRNTEHKEKLAKLRCHYVFRYFDDDGDGKLTPQDMLAMHKDILESKGYATGRDDVLNFYFKTCDKAKVALDAHWTEKKLVGAYTAKSLQGLSGICRAPKDVLNTKLYGKEGSITPKTTVIGPLCAACKPKQYDVEISEVLLNADGLIVDPKPIHDGDGNGQQASNPTVSTTEAFDAKSPVTQLLRWLRELSNFQATPERRPKGSVARNFYEAEDEEEYLKVINQVVNQAKAMYSKEPRVLRISSPCYVLGDIHGNLHDLMSYEQILWRKAPVAAAGSFLFLGDYVDRGDFGVECVLYLFCMKLLAPSQFFNLRGNHEVRALQRTFTFYKECEQKFGDSGVVWESFNQVFDVMPLCAVIDGHIFCAHGGIPTTMQELSCLGIPRPLSDPESMSPSAWEMLWNDPVNANDFNDYIEHLRVTSGPDAAAFLGGFVSNTKRGTAYFFSQGAVENFLRINGLSHVVRAHEVMNEGFRFFHQGKTTTVFSSSRYCNGTNEAACVFVCGQTQRLRVIKLDTRSSQA